MEEITSINNSLVKYAHKLLQKKYRDEENKFILEGYKCIDEAINSGVKIEYLFANDSYINKFNLSSGTKILTTDAILKKITTTDTPPGAVAIAQKLTIDENSFREMDKVILLENIKDSGNLGTILRTSAAFGIDGIVLYGDCTDIYNPKCVRAAVGNLWKIPFVYLKDIDTLRRIFNKHQRTATLPLSTNYLKDYKAGKKTLIMFGSEAEGLSRELINFSTDDIKIEMQQNVESLNLAISCAIVSYSVMFKHE